MGSKKLSSVEQLKMMLETKTDTNANMRVTVIEKGQDFFIVADKTGCLKVRISRKNEDALQVAREDRGILLNKLWVRGSEGKVLATQFTKSTHIAPVEVSTDRVPINPDADDHPISIAEAKSNAAIDHTPKISIPLCHHWIPLKK